MPQIAIDKLKLEWSPCHAYPDKSKVRELKRYQKQIMDMWMKVKSIVSEELGMNSCYAWKRECQTLINAYQFKSAWSVKTD